MATSPPISEVQRVTTITPIDLSGVRDPGMRALVLLAASLGWNVLQKIHNPIALTARDGTQRRLPTNTSIRMSVFQSALSTIMVHTEDRVGTPELIDAIVKETKIDRDHERRLRLAIGESPEEHKTRLANEKVAEQKRQPDEHLTQKVTIESPEVWAETIEEAIGLDELLPALKWTEPPHDGSNHGALVRREPFVAHHQTSGSRTAIYESDTSFEREWADGYKDYECMTCGKVYKAPKSVGAHSQVHTRRGEKDNSMLAYQRTRHLGHVVVEPKPKAKPKAKPPKDLVFEKLPPDEMTQVAMAEVAETTYDIGEDELSAESIIDRIAELVSPTWRRRALAAEKAVEGLTRTLTERTAELTKLRDDWDALKGLIGGR